MKNFVMMAAALVLGFTLQINDAEAKRIGGGGSTGRSGWRFSSGCCPIWPRWGSIS